MDTSSLNDVLSDRDALKKQLYNPVRWVDTIQFMHQQGVTGFIECGPGKVLSALNKRIQRGCKVAPLMDNNSLMKALELVE